MQTILIVDDAAETLQLLSELLQPYARVLVARSGRKALEIANSAALDLVLLDVVMPEMDGFEVIEKLRASPNVASATAPVIFVTSLAGGEDEERGLERGAVDYISKPIKPSVVIARVKTQLELRRARSTMQHRNVALELEIAARMRQNNLVRTATIRAFAHLAETRDNETGHHVQRTQEYVRLLAEELCTHPRFRRSLGSEELALIVECAPLHDIGKVSIPDAILRKPDKLTPEEFEVMKAHTTLGAQALEQAAAQSDPALDFLHVAADIARAHHERWDGTGYPDQLAGENIPVAARLMALADVFDALTSEHVYKRAMPVDLARDVILSGRGTHFDPAVVDAFEARLRDFEAVMRPLMDSVESADESDNDAASAVDHSGVQLRSPHTAGAERNHG